MLEQAEMESLSASLGDDSAPGAVAARSSSSGAVTPVTTGKRKRGRPRKVPLSREFVPNSDDEQEKLGEELGKRKTKKSAEAEAAEATEAAFVATESNLADDLKYSSNEEDLDDDDDADWEAVQDDVEEEDEEEEEEGLTVTIEGMDPGGQEAVVIEEGQIVDIGKEEKEKKVMPTFAFFGFFLSDGMGYLGDLPADTSASALLFGGPGRPDEHQDQQQQQVGQEGVVIEGVEEAEMQQVDESYDPTAFFSSIGKGDQQHQQQVEDDGQQQEHVTVVRRDWVWGKNCDRLTLGMSRHFILYFPSLFPDPGGSSWDGGGGHHRDA